MPDEPSNYIDLRYYDVTSDNNITIVGYQLCPHKEEVIRLLLGHSAPMLDAAAREHVMLPLTYRSIN